MNILLIGSGGREHAIAYKLSQSNYCSTLFIAPGNAGTTEYGRNVDLNVNDFDAVKDFILHNEVSLVVVGPEAPLVAGITDAIKADPRLKKVMVIGPSKEGAMLEGSKDFAKAFMERHEIPTAKYRTFTSESLQEGLDFLTTLQAPYVLKADGLAAGKGVLIIDNLEEAQQELRAMLTEAKFGEASRKVVIEEFLSGIELSVFVLTDGHHYVLLPSAKDYKRIGEGDTGLNTGGMGSISPVPFADKEFMKKVEQRIVAPTVKGLSRDHIDYCGFFFVGLMNVNGDPYVIEYNVRMGDPETESVMPRIKSDLVDLLVAAANGNLAKASIDIDPRTAVCVMMVAKGYPEKYEKGQVITDTELVKDSLVFHCGTRLNDRNQVVTNGGRVMCVTTLADNLPKALLASYQSADLIKWDGKYMRRDIGQDLLKYLVEE